MYGGRILLFMEGFTRLILKPVHPLRLGYIGVFVSRPLGGTYHGTRGTMNGACPFWAYIGEIHVGTIGTMTIGASFGITSGCFGRLPYACRWRSMLKDPRGPIAPSSSPIVPLQ